MIDVSGSLSEPHTYHTAVQNPPSMRMYARLHLYWNFTPHEYYMILPALGISAASVTTIYHYIYSLIYWWELNLVDCSKRVENRNWRILIWRLPDPQDYMMMSY